MTNEGVWWRIGPDGQPEGPFLAAEIRALLRRGRIWCADPVWSAQTGAWAALERTPLLDGDRATRPPLLALAVAALAFGAMVFAGLRMGSLVAFAEAVAPAATWLPRAALVGEALVIVAVALALCRLGRLCAARLRGRPGAARALRLGTGVAVMCAVLLGGGLIGATALLPQDATAFGAEAYTIETGPDPSRIVVRGVIGRGFGRAMRQALDRAPDPVRIEIDSPGGLAGEALEAALAIEQRPGATVVAGETCDSGCIVVLMGGTRRLAPKGSTLGFHARSDIRARSERLVLFGYDLEAALIDVPTDAFLIRRGVPAQIIDIVNRRGTRFVYRVSNEVLVPFDVLTDLVDPPQE
ncbi:DUF4339 domain-containing protein [Methylobacterium organophilum]|uniref:DUF4339 domain-containing protein n=1 Tax=Methylobacterium organophilum TaxID=410 RepID=UPI001F12D31F|nr:DUF4339 domain-containing protein [Methylobacterium organophilum]UMY17080.1 DUF4339 domain-containing protein [Methylobacterium organophilum]